MQVILGCLSRTAKAHSGQAWNTLSSGCSRRWERTSAELARQSKPAGRDDDRWWF